MNVSSDRTLWPVGCGTVPAGSAGLGFGLIGAPVGRGQDLPPRLQPVAAKAQDAQRPFARDLARPFSSFNVEPLKLQGVLAVLPRFREYRPDRILRVPVQLLANPRDIGQHRTCL